MTTNTRELLKPIGFKSVDEFSSKQIDDIGKCLLCVGSINHLKKYINYKKAHTLNYDELNRIDNLFFH